MVALRGALLFACLFVAGATFADDLPDLTKTPGAVRAHLSKKTICETRWSKDARHVTRRMKEEVFAAYGYSGNDDPRCVPDGNRKCEIDHLISRELGGADEVSNLWPQAYGTHPWNAQLKDNLENKLHVEMCAGRITLKQARDMAVNDWRIAYRRYYGAP